MFFANDVTTISLFSIALALAIISFGVSFYFAIRFVKNKHVTNLNYKKIWLSIFAPLGATVIFSLMMYIFIVLLNDYPFTATDWSMLVIGGILFSAMISSFPIFFAIYYYKTNLERSLSKIFFPLMLTSIIGAFIFFVPLIESYAPYMNFPLSMGIRFDENGISFPNYNSGFRPNIAWYALFILGGAVLVYFICDHRLYREYGQHGLLESTFLVALPAGIVGARIWFVIIDVIGNDNSIYRTDWTAIFRIWDGGLGIVGGAILGIVVGVLWFRWRHKGYDIFHIMDIVVPSILIAQAVGRWGNFFNYEVFGGETEIANWWFLPEFIKNQMNIGWRVGNTPDATLMYVPLFFIECVTNLFGFFVIAFIFGKLLKKYMAKGDLCFMYIIWYGITRAIMEPLRDGAFEYLTSWITAFSMIGVGLLLILVNHLVRRYLKDRKVAKNV